MRDEKYKWAALGVVMIGAFMAVLDGSIVNVALPNMMSSFGANVEEIRWVVTIYMITFAIVTLATNFLRELLGLKTVYILGLIIFTASSMLCGIAWNVDSMIAFRVLQALGGGVIFPSALTVISECFAPRERGAAFGTFGIIIVFAPTLGPTLGGYLVDYLSWRYVFYINLPVGIMGAMAAEMVLRKSGRLPYRGFDWAGFTGLSVFLVGSLLGLTEGQKEGWTSDYILTCLVLAAAGLVIFVAVDLRVKNPVLDISLFANLRLTVVCLFNLCRAVGLFGRIFLLPIFMQRLVGYSAIATGWLLAPGALVSGMSSPIFGRLSDRFGPKRFIIAGFSLLGLSMYLYKDLSIESSLWFIFWPQIVFGLGMGLMNAPLASTAMNVVRKNQIGMVSGLLSVILQLGGAFGVALLGTALSRRQAFHQAIFAEQLTGDSLGLGKAMADLQHLFAWGGEPVALAKIKAQAALGTMVARRAMEESFNDSFLILTGVCLVGLVLGLLLRRVKVVKT